MYVFSNCPVSTSAPSLQKEAQDAACVRAGQKDFFWGLVHRATSLSLYILPWLCAAM